MSHRKDSTGYRNPPRATQFQKGRSGNPKGRPKGSRDLLSVIEKELASVITVTEGGSPKTMTKLLALVKQLINKAVAGDPRLMSILLKAIDSDVLEAKPDAPVSAEDGLVMDSIVERIRRMDAPPPESETGASAALPSDPLPNTDTETKS